MLCPQKDLRAWSLLANLCLDPSDSDVEVISDEASVMPALSHALPSSNTLTSDSVPCGQFLLDLCSGAAAPLSKAAQRIGIDVLPINILVCHSHDLLQDSFYESLLRLAFSGRPLCSRIPALLGVLSAEASSWGT